MSADTEKLDGIKDNIQFGFNEFKRQLSILKRENEELKKTNDQQKTIIEEYHTRFDQQVKDLDEWLEIAELREKRMVEMTARAPEGERIFKEYLSRIYESALHEKLGQLDHIQFKETTLILKIDDPGIRSKIDDFREKQHEKLVMHINKLLDKESSKKKRKKKDE